MVDLTIVNRFVIFLIFAINDSETSTSISYGLHVCLYVFKIVLNLFYESKERGGSILLALVHLTSSHRGYASQIPWADRS